MTNPWTHETTEFLTELPTLSSDEFKAMKKRYTSVLADPVKELVTDLLPHLHADVSAGVIGAAKTNGSIAPINNDLRFNPDATPYKDHVMLRFWEGPAKRVAPMLMVHVAPTRVGFASGIVPVDVGIWREAVDERGEELAAAIDELATATGADVVGEELKRTPKPYDDDHPQAALLRHKMLQVRWILDAVPHEVDLVEFCATELGRTKRLHAELVRLFV